MSIKSQPVVLSHAVDADERVVKRCAVGFFRFVREVASYASEVPGIVQQAASDVVEAWEESSRPKA